MFEVPINIRLTPELEESVTLGESNATTNDPYSFEIGDSPIAFPLRKAFEHLGATPQSDLYKAYELWIVPHRISLLRRHGFAEVTSLGLEVEYLTGRQTCSVVSLLPSPRFVTHGAASLAMSGSIGETGEVVPGDFDPGDRLRLGGLALSASAATSLSFRSESVVSTPVVSAVGVGSRRCAWHFEKERDPLFGHTIETWSILALSKYQNALSYKMRAYITSRTLFFSTRRETEWKRIKCALSSDVGVTDSE